MDDDLDLLICVTCGTQFDVKEGLTNCHICDDPRQYVPPSGHSFTTLRQALPKHRNIIYQPFPDSPEIYVVHTEPKLGIGERAFLIKTTNGNVLWDLIPFIDKATIDAINELGGIQHIVISHPHYWTTHITWSHAFNNCPVHLSSADKEFLSRPDPHSVRSSNWIGSSPKEIVPGILAIPVGGHFPGSLVLLWKDHLFVADSVQVIPSGLYDIDRPAGTVSVAFMWSYPNMIPLPPSEISNITKSIEPYSFDILHGAFPGLDVFRGGKKKIFESARIVVGKMGYDAKAYISDLY